MVYLNDMPFSVPGVGQFETSGAQEPMSDNVILMKANTVGINSPADHTHSKEWTSGYSKIHIHDFHLDEICN